MSLLVVGSIAIDTVETPFGVARDVLGGSAVYFSFAATFFSPVRLVGVVGEDFPDEFLETLKSRPIELDGLEVVPGRTFRWTGSYAGNMDQAQTREVRLNVLGDFKPKIPPEFRGSEFALLANGPPQTQLHVLDQLQSPRFVLADTMNHWIETEREGVMELLGRADGLILNDAEARQLSGETNVLRAARWICEHGAAVCVIKKGENGSLLQGREGVFVLPAFPAERVKDPTGAGDAFGGGLMGYLAREGSVTRQTLKKALAYGTVTASFALEDFSLEGLKRVTTADVESRLAEFVECTHAFAPLPLPSPGGRGDSGPSPDGRGLG